MDIKVKGGQVLSGEITPSGNKNSAVALIPATLLFEDPITLKNVPDITDTRRLVTILEKLGSKLEWNKTKQTLYLDNSGITSKTLTADDVGGMKGTANFWGALLGRFSEVTFEHMPGGCTLGLRLPTTHYDAFEQLGIEITEVGTGVQMDAHHAKSTNIWLKEMSVTTTQTLIMFASTLEGKTRIVGAASEPHVQDMCKLLEAAGAKITGIGSSVLEIEGTKKLKAPKEFTLVSDYLEIATFLALGAITKGKVKVNNSVPEYMPLILETFKNFGVDIIYKGTTAYVDGTISPNYKNGVAPKSTTIKASPWPGLPVDMLPLFIPLAIHCKSGNIMFHNWMYESGLFWTSELQKLGAKITICDPHRVIIHGGAKLNGAVLEAPYIIRAVVAMVMIALVTEGDSTILNADALYRGHPNFAANLKKLGAVIEEI